MEYKVIKNETDYLYMLENYGLSTTNINNLLRYANRIKSLGINMVTTIVNDSVEVNVNLSNIYNGEMKIQALDCVLVEFCNIGGMFPSEPFNYDTIVSDINNNINEFDIIFTYKFGHFINRLPEKLYSRSESSKNYTIDNNEIFIVKPELDNLIEIDNTDKQIKYLHNVDGRYFLKL